MSIHIYVQYIYAHICKYIYFIYKTQFVCVGANGGTHADERESMHAHESERARARDRESMRVGYETGHR